MRSTSAGPVTVDCTSWDDAKAREQAGEAAFKYVARKGECVRVIISSKPSINNLLDAGAARCTYGYPDPEGVCRVWLRSSGRGISLHPEILTHDTMEPAGFSLAPEIDIMAKNPDGTLKYETYEVTEIEDAHDLHCGLPNWTKKMSPLQCAPRSPRPRPGPAAAPEDQY